MTTWTVRRRADVANRPHLDDVTVVEHQRYLNYWWYDDGTRLGLEGCLGAADGAAVARALDRLAGRLPDVSDDDDTEPVSIGERLETRRADALVALCSHHIASDADADRATVVIHAPLAAVAGSDISAASSTAARSSTPRRCAGSGATAGSRSCSRRTGASCRDQAGVAKRPRWLVRQLKVRDGGCTFPGCGARSFLKSHHVVWWGRGGATDIDNLTLCCHFHHELVHEGGWDARPNDEGTTTWIRPDGRTLGGRRAPPALAHA